MSISSIIVKTNKNKEISNSTLNINNYKNNESIKGYMSARNNENNNSNLDNLNDKDILIKANLNKNQNQNNNITINRTIISIHKRMQQKKLHY